MVGVPGIHVDDFLISGQEDSVSNQVGVKLFRVCRMPRGGCRMKLRNSMDKAGLTAKKGPCEGLFTPRLAP